MDAASVDEARLASDDHTEAFPAAVDEGLTPEERAWIAAHPIVRVGVPRAFGPISYQDRQNRLAGVVASLLDIVARRTGLSFEPVFEHGLERARGAVARGDAAMALATFPLDGTPTPTNLSLPFFRSRLALLTRRGATVDGTRERVTTRRVAVLSGLWDGAGLARIGAGTGNGTPSGQSSDGPQGISLGTASEPHAAIPVADTPSALAAVSEGKADAALLYQPVARYVVFHRYYDDFQFVGSVGPKIALHFVVRDEQRPLCSILNKALRTIPPQTIESFASQWTYAMPVQPARGAFAIPSAMVVSGIALLAAMIYNVRLWQRIRARQRTARALRRRLAFLFRLVDANPHSIYFRDGDGRLRECNRAFCEAIGRPKSELVGRRLDEMYFFPETTRCTLARAQEHIRQGGDRYAEEVTIQLNCSIRTGVHWAVPLHGKGTVPSRSYAGMIGGWIDLTEQKHLQDALRIARDEARAADRAKTMFLATMSHEVRTPMNIVIGMLELIARSDDPEAVRHAQLAREAATGLLKILNDILEVSRAEFKEMPFDLQVGNLAEVLRAATALFQTSARAKGLALTFSADDALPHTLRFDPSRIRQIAYNLVGNAVKFTDAGRIDVELRLLKCTPESCLVEMRVSDTGIGMDARTLRDAFEPFRQGGVGTYRRYGGSGMGLAICQRIVAAMQGRITLESEAGLGTQASLVLPLTRVRSQPAPSPKARPSELASGGALGPPAYEPSQYSDAPVAGQSSDTTQGDAGSAAANANGTSATTGHATPQQGSMSAGAAPILGPANGSTASPRDAKAGTVPSRPRTPRDTPVARPALPLVRLAPGATVLAVDDHPANRVLLTSQLRRLGLVPCPAESGEDALVILADRTVDVILTDCSMRGIDGFALAAKIAALCDVPVIGYSADPSDACFERCLRAGMVGCLVKPVGLNELAHCLGLPADAAAGPGSPVSEAASPSANQGTTRGTARGTFPAAPRVDRTTGTIANSLAPSSGDRSSTYEHLLTLANHEPETARTLLTMFAEGLEQSREAVATEDLRGLIQQAHRNKGPAAMLGLVDFVAACDTLTRACNSGVPSRAALDAYLDAVDACRRRLTPLRVRLDTDDRNRL